VEKKKILAYSVYYAPDVASTGQIYTELFEELTDDFDITVICSVPSYTGKIPEEYREKKFYFEERNGVHVIRVPVREFSKDDKKSRVMNMMDFWIQTRKATRTLKDNFDLIFAFSGPPIIGGMLGVYGSKKTNAPLVYGIQDFNPEQTMAVGYAGGNFIHKVMMYFDKRSCRYSSTVVVPGHDLQETLINRFAGQNAPASVVINNWTDDKSVVPLSKDNSKVMEFRKRHGLQNKFVIMYSGNIGLYYDLENLIKVIGEFSKRDDIVFAFVGEGAIKQSLLSYVQSNEITNVKFIPYQAKEDLVFSLNAADVHLVTNAKGIKGISCPSKVYGVMATNVPIIGVLEEGSEVWRLIEESNCGVLAHAGSYSEFRSVLSKVIDEKENFVEKHATGRKYLDAYLTRDIAVNKYRDLFRKLTA
jgi:glycosyltransferase involved in cell wall biosynthesis